MTSEERFRAAVNVIKNLPKQGSFQPSTELQLKFYSYFKQATEGPCTIAKPSFWDVVGKAKWDAWKSLGDMPKEEAMGKYVDELKQIIETMSFTESVSKFVEILGPFYEFVPLSKMGTLNGDKGSDDDDDDAESENMGNHLENKGKSRVNGYGDSESEGDEFSDTYDHIKEARGGTGSQSVPNLRSGSDSGMPSTTGSARTPRTRHPRDLAAGSLPVLASGSGGTSGGGGGPSGSNNVSNISEHLALAVIKLQHSLDNINSRLDMLERGLGAASTRKKGLMANLGVSSYFLALVLLWPFVAQWLMHLARRRN